MSKEFNQSSLSEYENMLKSLTNGKSITTERKSEFKLDENSLNTVWNVFGRYIARNLKSNKAILIPKFGIFTFTAPEVTLNGVTNPEIRDKQQRQPVFIVSKEFISGQGIKSGIYSGGNARPYTIQGSNGSIQQIKINYSEIGLTNQMEHDFVKFSIEKQIANIFNKIRSESYFQMQIPYLGQLILRNNILAFKFDESLWHEVRSLSSKSIKYRNQYQKSSSVQGRDDIQSVYKLDYELEIDGNASEYLQRNYQIDVKSLSQYNIRPNTTQNSGLFENNFQRPSTSFNKNLGSFDSNQKQTSNPHTAKLSQIINNQSLYNNSNIQQQQNTLVKIRQKKNISQREAAMNKVTLWMRKNNISIEDTFFKILNCLFGTRSHKSMKIDRVQLGEAFNKLGIELQAQEIDELFNELDSKRDGYLDKNEWEQNILNENWLLQYIRDIILKYHLQTDDVLKRMNIQQNKDVLTASELENGILKIDQYFDRNSANIVAKSILKGKKSISVAELISILGCNDDDNLIDENWYKSTQRRIKRGLMKLKNPNILKEELEKWDIKNQGRLDIANFKTCLIRLKLDLSVQEINRLVRYIEKDGEMMIDYNVYLSELENIQEGSTNSNNTRNTQLGIGKGFQKLAENLVNYMKQNGKMNVVQILRYIYKRYEGIGNQQIQQKVSNQSFTRFIMENLNENQTMSQFQADYVDIDQDGYISKCDLETFLERYTYIQGYFKQQENLLLNQNEQSINSIQNTIQKELHLFPTVPLNDDKLELVLRDLKQALADRRINYHEVFKIFDTNEDGFLTINELSNGLDQILKLSTPVKEGLFAYLDSQKIGFIDQPQLIAFLQKNTGQKKVSVVEDNWDWQNQVLVKIRQWYRSSKLSIEDAFRTFDADFDGFISKEDLNKFLKDILRLSVDEITTSRVDRLFKIMDQFKRGKIQLSDFKLVVQTDSESLAVTGGQSIPGKSSFDWRINAKQQIGLILSQKYPDIKTSFDNISEHKNRLTYQQFKEWIERENVLSGFNLTNKLLQQLFSELDSHKKGYLQETDWENGFGNYSWDSQIMKELEEAIQSNFSDVKEAFKYFVNSGSNLIFYNNFSAVTKNLISKRFSKEELLTIWKKLSSGQKSVDFQRFCQCFQNLKFHKKNTQRDNISDFTNKNEKNINFVIDKLKSLLKSSKISLEQAFQGVDKEATGKLNNVQFRTALKSLNLGLTIHDIDLLLNSCDVKTDGWIHWKEFSKKFKLEEVESKIILRSKNRIDKLKENLYSYLLSPKDAFRMFNDDNSGRMTFEQFNKLILKVSQLSGEETPSFSIIKDLFNYIDIRKDGIIDIAEWQQTLIKTNDNYAQSSGGLQSYNQQNDKGKFSFSVSKLHSSLNLAKQYDSLEWEALKEHDEILKAIGRNRKTLLLRFSELYKQGNPITREIAKNVISSVLNTQNLIVQDSFWPLLFKFAEKDGLVDYKFLFEVYRERINLINTHPKDKRISTAL